jgi:hypothetical protein
LERAHGVWGNLKGNPKNLTRIPPETGQYWFLSFYDKIVHYHIRYTLDIRIIRKVRQTQHQNPEFRHPEFRHTEGEIKKKTCKKVH